MVAPVKEWETEVYNQKREDKLKELGINYTILDFDDELKLLKYRPFKEETER